MEKKYILILTFLTLAAFLFPMLSIAQKAEKEKKIIVESIVKDEKGNPVSGATIFGNEGAVVTKTDEAGKFTIAISEQTDMLIESDGYESAVFKAGDIKTLNEFTLRSSLFMYSEKDDVNIAFGKVKKGNLVNAVGVINPSEILKYDDIQTVSQALDGRVPGMLGSSNIRGIGNALFIVDGLPRNIANINLAEIEQISVLKDINSSILYGNDAVNGVVLITTKRGQAFKKQINVTGFYGVSTPTALPEYLSSADYMQLYNEAKVNDGLVPQFDEATIANYRNGNPYRFPSVDYYSKEYLTDIKPYSKVMTELSGGNDIATYYSNIGWEQSGSYLDFGKGESAKQTRFNARGNVDMKINSRIKSSIDAVAVLNNSNGPVGNYWGDAATLKPHLFTPLIPFNYIYPNSNTDALLNGRKNDVKGMYLLGGNKANLTNPIANVYSGGENENVQRTFSFDNRIDFDLGQIIKGLAFHTNVSFDYYTTYDQTIKREYSVYDPIWKAGVDSIISLEKNGNDVNTGSQNIGNAAYMRRIGFYGMFDYDRTFGGTHHFSGSLIGYGNRYKIEGNLQGTRNVNLGLRVAYDYKNKFLVDFSSAYVSSAKLPEGNRTAFSPSLGLGWVIASDDVKTAASTVNYLKLRASAGRMHSDAGISGFYYYDNVYGGSGSYAWNDGGWSNTGTISINGGNNSLGFEYREELNVGLEGILFNHKLSFDANVFTSVYADQITRPTTMYPSFYTEFIPYQNFDSNAYKGAELGLSFNQPIGNLKVVLGANVLYATSEVLKKDEIYANDYQYRVGYPVDARFGLVADGFFRDQADIDNHDIQAFGAVKPGDIKYVDQNNDGIIDTDDEVMIGRSQAPLSFGLNLKLSYKNLTLFAHGNGRRGADGYTENNYYWVDGDDKYSVAILDRWTEATKETATMPRLSSLANKNNYRSSTFWLYKDDYFTLDRVQLSYEVPTKAAGILKMKNLNFYVNASNIFTVSNFKEYRELRVGAEPYSRSFSIGVKTMF